MSRIDRYIMAHVFGLTTIVALALVSIQTFVAFVAEVDQIGRGDFGYQELFVYTLWLAPSGLYVMLPIIAMLGTLMGLGTLASQSELTAMRAAGVSLLRIGGSTLFAGLFLGAFTLLVGDWLAPRGQYEADALKTLARSGVRAGVGGKPVWVRDGDHIFNIRRLLGEDRIEAVDLYSLRPDLSLASASTIEQGTYRDGRWEFRGIQRTEFGPAQARVSVAERQEWPGSLSPDLLRLFVLEADALSMAGLSRLIVYMQRNNLDSSEYELTLARKIVAPLTVMAMMLLAVPFVLGPLRNTGAGQRLFIGILIGLVFYVVNEVSANSGRLYGWPPLLSAGAPTVAFGLLALWRLGRVR